MNIVGLALFLVLVTTRMDSPGLCLVVFLCFGAIAHVADGGYSSLRRR